MVVEERPDIRNLKPLGKPTQSRGINLFVDQWDWLAQTADQTGVPQSELVRRAVALLRESVNQHGVDGPILGKV